MQVIFLNNRFRDLMADMKWDYSILAGDKIQSYFSASDIAEMTRGIEVTKYRYLILETQVIKSLPPEMEGDVKEPCVPVSDYSTLPSLGAFCPDENTLVLWEHTDDELEELKQGHLASAYINNMFGSTLISIVKAFSRVMSHDDLVRQKQFGLAIFYNKC